MLKFWLQSRISKLLVLGCALYCVQILYSSRIWHNIVAHRMLLASQNNRNASLVGSVLLSILGDTSTAVLIVGSGLMGVGMASVYATGKLSLSTFYISLSSLKHTHSLILFFYNALNTYNHATLGAWMWLTLVLNSKYFHLQQLFISNLV